MTVNLSMKKLVTLTAGMAMAGLMSGSALATAIDTQLAARIGNNVIITDESGEFAVDANQNGQLDTGDILAGALDFTTITPPQTFWNTTGRELTAVFGNKVDADSDAGFGYNDLRLVGAGAAFWTTNHAWLGGTNYKDMVDATFAGNTIDWDKVTAILFDDSTSTGTNFDRSTVLGTAMANASDGLIRGVMGFSDTDDFWIARSQATLATFSTTVTNQGSYIFGQTFLAENFTVDFADVDGLLGGPAFLGSPYATGANTLNQITGDGGVFGSGNTAASGKFTIYNKLDVTVKPIPEPATLGLLGLGLLGLAAMRRSKA